LKRLKAALSENGEREDFRREVKVQVVIQKVNAGVRLWPSPGCREPWEA
jgi:hypothetical protein